MGELSFLADEHVDRAFVTGLQANGFEVAVVGEDYPTGEDDVTLLDVCEEQDLVLLTNDRDFVRLGQQQPHPGVVIYTSQGVAVGDFVGAIRRIDDHFSPESMREQVVWLTQWL